MAVALAERTLLVTGASGGFGRRLVPLLAAQPGRSVRALAHRRAVDAGVETVRGDLRHRESLAAALVGVETVLHLAAVTHSHAARDYREVNAEGTRNLVAAAAAAGVRRVVLMSSRAAVPGGGAYAASKLAAEEAVRGAPLEWVVLRPAEVYGPGSTDAVATLVHWLRRWGFAPVVAPDQGKVAPAHLDDVAAATCRALDPAAPSGRVHTLAGDEELTLRQLVGRIARVLGVPGRALPVPLSLARMLAAGCRLVGSRLLVADQMPRLLAPKSGDLASARRDLAFAPRPLDAGLADWLDR